MRSQADIVMQLIDQNDLDFQKIDWGSLYPILKNNALTPWIYATYKNQIEANALALYEKDYYLNALINESLLAFGQELKVKFGESITYVKGASLITELYDNLPVRVFYDIDVLIDPSFRKELTDYLLALDFEEPEIIQWEAANNRSNYSNLIGHQMEINIDVHTTLFWKQNKEVVWQKNGGHLSKTDHFFYLTMNWIYQDTFVGLNKYLDLRLFWKRYTQDIDKNRLNHLIEIHQVERVFEILFSLLTKADTKLAWYSKLITADFLINPKQHFVKYFLFKHLCKSNLFQAFLYDLGWLNARLWHFFPFFLRDRLNHEIKQNDKR